MVRMRHFLVVAITICCALILVSCGGHTPAELDTLAGDGAEITAGPLPFDGLPPFPIDEEVPGDSTRAASAYVVESYDGADFDQAECYTIERGLVHPGTQHMYDALNLWSMYSEWINVPGTNMHVAYALYRRPGIGQQYPPADFRKLVFEVTAAYGSDYPFPDDGYLPKPEYWVALANWDQQAWQFIGGPYGDLPETGIDLTTLNFNYLSPNFGHLHYLIVVPENHNVVVHNTYLVVGDSPPIPPAPPGGEVDAKTHEFYRAYRHYLMGTRLGLAGSRTGQWGFEELGSDTAYAMYYKTAQWFGDNVGDLDNLQSIEIHASPEMPPPWGNDEYWFALANFDTGDWEYYGPLSSYPSQYIDLSGATFNFLSPLGNFYFMILAKEANGVVIDWAKFFVSPPAVEEWPMFKRNLQRTSCTTALGPSTNNVMWWFFANDDRVANSAVVGSDGTVYVAGFSPMGNPMYPNWGATMYALEPTAGGLKWQRNFGGLTWINDAAAVDDQGDVYFTINYLIAASIWALYSDGTDKWSSPMPLWATTPAIDGAGQLYAGTVDPLGGPPAVCQIEQLPGGGGTYTPNIVWSFVTPGPATVPPAMDTSGNIYTASTFTAPYPVTKFYALDPNGVDLWSPGFGFTECHTTPAVAPDGTIYFGVIALQTYQVNWPPRHGAVIAFNPDGTVKWQYDCDYGVPGTPIPCDIYSSPAIAPDGTIWFGTRDNKVIGLDPATGARMWEFATAGPVDITPAIDGSGRVYFGADDRHVYCIEPSGAPPACNLVWSYDTGDVITGSPAIGSNGLLYIGNEAGVFYAYGP